MAKKKQQLPDLTKQDVLTPLDISQLGTNGDPCFGIGYDLSTKECKLCGDSELCAFKMSQNLNITRKELEQKNQYKDLDILEDTCLLYTSPSPRDRTRSRMPSSA